MELTGMESGYAFARNPVVIKEKYISEPGGDGTGKFTLSLGGKKVYDGRFSSPLEVDVAEILDSWSGFYPEVPEGNTAPIVGIEDTDALEKRRCVARFEYGEDSAETDFLVLPGGVSRQNLRRLREEGKDPFTGRFLIFGNNYFLTTRTSGWRVFLKETELYPFYFLVHQIGERMMIREMASGNEMEFDRLMPGIHALDVETARRLFFRRHGVLPNVLDIYMAGVFSCRVVVERSEPVRERYRLKFRNSLGVFEILELPAPLTVRPEWKDAEESTFDRYDPDTGWFRADRGRVGREMVLKTETGVLRPDEVRFLMDLIGSEEVYLLDLVDVPVRVIPSAEDLSFRHRPETPQTFSLSLKVCDSELNVSEEIGMKIGEGRQRVFSREFSKQFN